MTDGILDSLFSQHCCICNNLLTNADDFICPHCLACVQTARNGNYVESKVAKLFWGKTQVCRGASMWTYSKGSHCSKILVEMKYGKRIDICRKTGRMFAASLLDKNFFSDIDVIIPIPLAEERKRQRGYNQAEQISLGIHDATGLPVNTHSLVRVVNNPSQTTVAGVSRNDNVKDIFSLSENSCLDNMHILVVDDILTTGATINSAIQEIMKGANNCTFSILTIGLSDNS